MNQPDQESVRIGRQIRDLRKAKGITLQSMADRIERSVGYVSQVERGVSALPIPVLQLISDVLGVQITWFFHAKSEQPLDEVEHIVRAGLRRQINYSGTGIHEELLSPSMAGDLLMILTTLSPLAASDKQQRKHRGEEAGYLQSGTLQLTLGEKKYCLEAGDSFCIKSNETHQIRNPSKRTNAVVVWVITPPNY